LNGDHFVLASKIARITGIKHWHNRNLNANQRKPVVTAVGRGLELPGF
jgi:hypothetical protein